jgi:UDP-glucose 6-dehydrogenase
MSREFENEAKVLFTARNYDALKSADALIVLTEWDEFRNPDFDKISDLILTKYLEQTKHAQKMI